MNYALIGQLAQMDAEAANRLVAGGVGSQAPAPNAQPAMPPQVAQNPMQSFMNSRRRMFGDPAQGNLGPMHSPFGRTDIPMQVPFRKSGPINPGGDMLVG